MIADSVSMTTAASLSANYSTLALIALSLAGVLLHMLTNIAKEKQRPAPFVYSWVNYWSKTWPTTAASIIICAIIITVRHEFMQVPDFSNWEGLAMALCGYLGDSILIPAINFLSNKYGIKADQ